MGPMSSSHFAADQAQSQVFQLPVSLSGTRPRGILPHGTLKCLETLLVVFGSEVRSRWELVGVSRGCH